MKAGNIQSAPLYVVYGSLTSDNTPSVRLYPLKKARNKNGVWFYPTTGGNAMVPKKMLGSVDDQTTPGGKLNFKVFFEEKKYINSMVELMNKKLSKMAGKPIVKSLPAAVKSEASKQAKSLVVSNKPATVSPKISAKNMSVPSGTREFYGQDLEDYVAVQNILNGHKNEFAVLYKRYYNIILFRYSQAFNFQQNELAEDLLMEMFEKVFEKLGQYVPKYTFNAWITKIAKNYLIDYCRKMKNIHMVSIKRGFADGESDFEGTTEENLADDGSTCPENLLIKVERKEALMKALSHLDDQVRRMVIMRYFYKATYAEIIEKEKVSESHLKISLYRAKQKLREVLTGNLQLLEAVTV